MDEVVKGSESVGPASGPGEVLVGSGVVFENRIHKADNLTGSGIRLETNSGEEGFWPLLSEGISIAGVEIPFSSGRLVSLHKDVVAFSHFAVEEFHAELLAALGVLFEILRVGKERVVLVKLEGNLGESAGGLEGFENAAVAGADEQDFGGRVFDEKLRERIGERGLRVRRIEFLVVNCVSGILLQVCEASHGSEEQSYALFG